AEVLFGYPRDELLGQPMEILVPERFRGLHTTQRAHYAAAPTVRPMGAGLDLYARRKDGSEFPTEISLSPMVAEGQLVVISIIRDITERKPAEAERAALQRATERQKDEFITNVSHDLRTPLTGIKASIGVVLANEPPGTPEPIHRMLVNVDLAADRMGQLVADLLELSRLQAGRVQLRPAQTDLRRLALAVTQAIEPLAQGRGQRVEVDVPEAPVPATVDADRLERALLNLLSNAHKYGREGGTIRLRLVPGPDEVRFAVADDGPGVPAEEQERIFERFY